MSSTTSLPPLDTPCVKCGGSASSITWVPAAGDDHFERTSPPPYEEAREHMRVTCKQCGFVWAAAPLDGKGGP